ncbi:hypothetical protein KFK09_020686 [Dendrobium nobile]|uniref:Uncharacterized protein n=1 Tax=Dendrobium nobile TaxID=94219 RepID=A0A8T3AN37_DENNO|nr:hypothetical protein KFK09_020686 [Dendrobium nobile]
MVSQLGLSTVPHPNPYKVAWVNSTALELKERSNVPISFAIYKENVTNDSKTNPIKSKKGLNLVTAKVLDTEVAQGALLYALVGREIPAESDEPIPQEVQPILGQYADVFSDDLPDQLPPLRDIQHAIDFVPGASQICHTSA